MSDLATCVVCGKKYKACLSCKEQLKIRPWQHITDTAECYKIFLALSQYNNGYITKDEAKQELLQIKYDKSELYENIQKSIDKIMDTGKPIEKDAVGTETIGIEVKTESEIDSESENKNSYAMDSTTSTVSINSNADPETSPTISTSSSSMTMTKTESVKKNKSYKKNAYKNK